MADGLELLSPAGDRERLRMALLYGADAVYLAGRQFGMRAASANFSDEELRRKFSSKKHHTSDNELVMG